MNVDTPNNARLVIHSEGASGADGLFESTLRRLRSLHSIATRLYARSPLAVQIDDLQGRSVLTIAAAGPLLDVPLPAGTYHVIANLGDVRCSYTMRLEQGESLDLHLRFKTLRR